MKKFRVLIGCMTLISLFGFSGIQEKTYPIVVHFNSICCGTPDAKPLADSIHLFLRQNKLKTVKAYRVGPMGKEGEYDLVFDLKDLKKSKRSSFMAMLERVAATLKDRGAAYAERNLRITRNPSNTRIQWTKISFK